MVLCGCVSRTFSPIVLTFKNLTICMNNTAFSMRTILFTFNKIRKIQNKLNILTTHGTKRDMNYTIREEKIECYTIFILFFSSSFVVIILYVFI